MNARRRSHLPSPFSFASLEQLDLDFDAERTELYIIFFTPLFPALRLLALSVRDDHDMGQTETLMVSPISNGASLIPLTRCISSPAVFAAISVQQAS
jgi:hypothetical protein